ncbi:MAG: hypothetical protein JSU63_08395, partial [Phycisphaerales bacterium]
THGGVSLAACTCLACDGEGWTKEFDEVLAALVAGGGQTGEDFPGVLAAGGLVAAGELAGDDRRAQGTLGPVAVLTCIGCVLRTSPQRRQRPV